MQQVVQLVTGLDIHDVVAAHVKCQRDFNQRHRLCVCASAKKTLKNH